jgi:retron-type reverse transcriptase
VSSFEEIPHDRLMQAIEERICDRKLLRLLRAMLRSGVMEEGAVRRSDTGTPQGGVISPLLSERLPRPARPAVAGARGAAGWCATPTIWW